MTSSTSSKYFYLAFFSSQKSFVLFVCLGATVTRGDEKNQSPPIQFQPPQDCPFSLEEKACLVCVDCGKVGYVLPSRMERKASVHTRLRSPFKSSRKSVFIFLAQREIV